MKVVIVGGVAGGASAAARLRRLDETAEIIMIERTGYVSYANCGLPYYVGGVIADKRKLTLQTPESFRKRFHVDVRVRQEVTSIDRAAKTVAVRRLDDGSDYVLPYDKLILSPGARPLAPALPGLDAKQLFTLRTVEDTFAIAEFIEASKPASAVVVGAGFIGMEMAENLVERGIEVTMVQRDPHVMPTLDADMAALAQNELRAHGVRLLLNANVTGFVEREGGIAVSVEGGAPLEADLAVLAIGVAPESELARNAGLELGVRGSIKVDERMVTSDPDILAVGDAVEVRNFATGEPALIALAGPANRQGRIAADVVCGIDRAYKGSQGTSVMKLFDLTVASTGLTCRAAQASGLDFDAVVLSPANHATYYPGASTITLKVVFERESGLILGAQAIGREGAEKRIDVVATAMRAHMDARDLAELDLAYAPPYSSAKDPVNVAGYMIQNIVEGLVKQVDWHDVLAAGFPALDEDATAKAAGEKAPVLIDVRTDGEYAHGHVEGALHIPLDELRDRLDELPRDRELWVHCQTGLRSYLACRILAQHGFDCANVAGGYVLYQQVALNQQAQEQGAGPCGLA